MASSCWFLVFVWVWWLPLMLVPAEGQQQGAGCSAKTCGNLTFSDPFWLTDLETGRPCGSRDFEVTCYKNTSIIQGYGFSGFGIIRISYEARSLVATDLARLKVLQTSNSCDLYPTWNASAKLGPQFRIDPVNLNMILYNCKEVTAALIDREAALIHRELVETTMRCENQSRVYAREAGSYNETSNYAGYAIDGCDACVVPVLRSSPGVVNASHYAQLIGGGFLVTWEPPLHPPPLAAVDKSNFRLKICAGIATALLCLVVLSIVCIFHNVRRKRKRSASLDNLILRGGSMLASPKKFTLTDSPLTHIFSYEELDEATDGFSDARVLGAGGFGTVYKGILRDGSVLAVKRLYKNSYKGVEQFANEVDILSRLRHPNLVAFYGCTSSSLRSCCRDLLLAYEFVPNGTLANHLNYDGEATFLPWPTHLGIAVEAAGALAYLHAHQIVHRDVKTSNILLDEEFHVKVADFGLSRLFPPDATHVSTAPQGTPGYVDPAYNHMYHLTDKSDVYSFGVVLVELFSSRPAVDMSQIGTDVNLASMAVRMIQCREIDNLVDPRLGYGSASDTMKTVDLVAEVAFRCLQPEQEVRPSINEVLDVLREAHQTMMERGGCGAKDNTLLLKKSRDGSPDSVMHQWISPSTTSNYST